MLEQYIPSKPPIVVEPVTNNAEKVVIWLHGLGADGHDFEQILPELKLPADHSIRFIFPTAQVLPLTINLGAEMNAWYDFKTLQLFEQVDWEGIQKSVSYIHHLIEQQVTSGIAPNRILLAGFSQGGVIALHAALSYLKPLAGVMALSTYFPSKQSFQANQDIKMPIFWGHGLSDPICSYTNAEISRASLQRYGFAIDWNVYEMEHQVCVDEIDDMSRFLTEQLINE